MSRTRLDQELARQGLVASRSQAENYIKLGKIKVGGQTITKPGHLVVAGELIEIASGQQYVSRAALKLASVADKLGLDFKDRIVLDVGSSTGGFTDFALRNGAKKVIAVDVGTDQLHPSIRANPKVEIHEKTDIRDLYKAGPCNADIVLIDVSFISVRLILPSVSKLVGPNAQIVAMLKPQFEAGSKDVNKGVIKNDSIRRQILKDFEDWARGKFLIQNKADSEVTGAKGNRERFYLLRKA